MAGSISSFKIKKKAVQVPQLLTEPRWLQRLAIGLALAFLTLVLFVPLVTVFYEAFKAGLFAYFAAVFEPDALSAMGLTLLVIAWVIPLNTVFGLAAAWLITKFNFVGKNILISLIDLPFAVSPVISGLIFVQLFGRQGWLGEWMASYGIKIIFSVPGIILATLFVTFPFVVRELIPLMLEQGTSEEEAAVVLGANGWQTFFKVTLPNIKWALLYGVILLNARAIGEFGAVSVVSGHIRGLTNTMPLHIEILYNEYQFVAAFVIASLLSLFTLFTIGAKTSIKNLFKQEIKGS
jgi:sulfate transport system permease protein